MPEIQIIVLSENVTQKISNFRHLLHLKDVSLDLLLGQYLKYLLNYLTVATFEVQSLTKTIVRPITQYVHVFLAL